MEALNIPYNDIELIPVSEVRRITGMGTTFIYTQIAAGKFPRQRKVGRSARWIKSEVIKWVETTISHQ